MRTLTCLLCAALLASPAAFLASCAVAHTTESPAPSPASPEPQTSLGGVSEASGGSPPSGGAASGPLSAISPEGRDRQFEILNEAVTALRQEASRSYQRATDLARETERLRALVASLHRRLEKSREDNRELLDHVRQLEERLQEVRTPPPETAEEAPPKEPPPAPQAPVRLAPAEDATPESETGGPPADAPDDSITPSSPAP